MANVIGLGHVGIYVRDLERMVAFYQDTLGMRVTKQNWRAGIVFLSTDPESADHEIALFRGRPEGTDSQLIKPDLASCGDPRGSAELSPEIGCRGLSHRRGCQPRERAGLLLFRSGGQSLGSILGYRPSLLGADCAFDRY